MGDGPTASQHLASNTHLVSLGSNLGDSVAMLRTARTLLRKRTGASEVSSAPLYQTEPIDCPPDTPVFLNTILSLVADLTPHELLSCGQQIEVELGRPEDHGFHEPRTVDIDLIASGSAEINSSLLTLPHPRAHLRSFVLTPLADLYPDLILPGKKQSTQSLLQALPKEEPGPSLFLERW